MDDYVPKPLQGEALDAALARCAAAPLDGNGDEAVDAETIERLRAELDGIGRAGAVDGLVEEFVSSLGQRVDEIRSALAKGDAEVVRESAHALKGAAATLGATRLAAVCAAMERAGRDGDLEHARDLIVDLTEAAEATESGLSRALQIGLQPSQ
jgi:HPt (histidine-containing phosphotransfer) domain-containing protein